MLKSVLDELKNNHGLLGHRDLDLLTNNYGLLYSWGAGSDEKQSLHIPLLTVNIYETS
jgi:hypothetical protein